MEIKVYLHRTKKKQFEVADCFSVFVDLDKLPENQHDEDLVDAYKKYLQINTKRHL